MSSAIDFVMSEHPAWKAVPSGRKRVFVTPAGGRWLATVDGHSIEILHLGGDRTEPASDRFALPPGTADEAPELATALRSLGSVTRFRGTDLWQALGTAILRQVIRAAQSKKLYRAFCAAHGEPVELPNGDTYVLFPTANEVLKLGDEQFDALGLAFKRHPLRTAAAAYLEFGDKWRQLPLPALVDELQNVPRIGPWTAGAAVADFGNNWALYPYADLAVRTWAGRAAPLYEWYSNERAFGIQWRRLAGEHLSALTLLTLAWGSRHGDIG